MQRAFQVLSEAARIHSERAAAKKTEDKTEITNNERGNTNDDEPDSDINTHNGSGDGDS